MKLLRNYLRDNPIDSAKKVVFQLRGGKLVTDDLEVQNNRRISGMMIADFNILMLVYADQTSLADYNKCGYANQAS